jgi:peptide/nickel transport system substrate-binding protein
MVWEGQDAATFANFPPVTISAYEYAEHDPNGSWFLWRKRDDWQNSDVGQMIGEPEPDFVLFRSYGTEERRVLAMAADDMDILTDISPESLDILMRQNENVRAWFTDFPYANLDDPCERGMHFNTAVALMTTRASAGRWRSPSTSSRPASPPSRVCCVPRHLACHPQPS